MATILNTKSIYYNDINVLAGLGVVNSRKEVPKELFRIITSPMSSIAGPEFVVEAARLGLTVCLHRFCPPKEELFAYEVIPVENRKNVYCAIGLKDYEERLVLLNKAGCSSYILDIAHGTLPCIPDFLKNITKKYKISKIMVGNIHTQNGFDFLRRAIWGAKIEHGTIRCGISGGSPCSSSDVTGVNRGQISEIMECAKAKSFSCSLVADGGIKNSGYLSKAFAAGADFAIMGGFFTKAKEAYTNLHGDGTYYGGASERQQKLAYGKVIRHSEGKEIPRKDGNFKPLKELVEELWGGVASYVSYSGYKTLTEAIGNGVFEIKTNSLPPKDRY
jgi:IMP dehydrogenase/GMP reductase